MSIKRKRATVGRGANTMNNALAYHFTFLLQTTECKGCNRRAKHIHQLKSGLVPLYARACPYERDCPYERACPESGPVPMNGPIPSGLVPRAGLS
jgi:hypothetical protein